MQLPTTFVSSFAPQFLSKASPVKSNQKCAQRAARMTLVSHEKLDVVFASPEGETAKYRLDMEIPADFSKKKRRESIQAMKKHADFRGFRKGTIPPFILKEMDGFVFRDSAEEIIDASAKELNLARNNTDESEMDYDVETLQKQFKSGENFQFSCEVELSSIVDNDDPDVIDLDDVVSVAPEDESPIVNLNEVQAEIKSAEGTSSSS